MWELLHLIFVGHRHKWKIIAEADVFRSGTGPANKEDRLPINSIYVCQCEVCGKIKRSYLR